MSLSSPSVPNLIKIGTGVASPHIDVVIGYRYFFYSRYLALGHAHSRRRTLDPHIYTSIDAVWSKDVSFGASSAWRHPWGSNPQTPHLGLGMGISSVNVFHRISAKNLHSTTLDNSKCATRRDAQRPKNLWIRVFVSQVYGKLPQRAKFSQIHWLMEIAQ
jgi:hypothetical protein